MKIVLDTDVIVAALRSPSGASADLLRRARQEQITLAASVSLFMEYEAVCTRAEHLEASGLSARQLDYAVQPVIRQTALTTPVIGCSTASGAPGTC